MSKQAELLNELTGISEKFQSTLSELKGLLQEPSETETAFSKEDVRQVLARLAGFGHRDEVRELIKKYGAESLGSLDPSNYAAIMADAEAIDHE